VLGGVQGGQPAQLELGKIDFLGEVKPGEVLGAIAATTAQQIEQHRGVKPGSGYRDIFGHVGEM